MKVTLPNFKNAKIMVVGDIMLDRYWYGLTSHISQEAPVPVVKINSVEERPGGAANVAMNIASLGANSILVGITGKDNEATVLTRILSDAHVKCNFVSFSTLSTIIKLRVLSCNQQLIRLDFEKKFENIDPNLLYNNINKSLKDIGVLVLSDYAKGTLTNISQIIHLACKIGIPTLVDPKGNDFECYRGATLLTPNFSEFEEVVGKCRNEKEIVERGMQLITDFEFSSLLITRSEKGMTLLKPDRAPLHILTKSKEIYDVTGAGDTVISMLAVMLATKHSIEEACYFANAAASIVIGKQGTSTIIPIELENVLCTIIQNQTLE